MALIVETGTGSSTSESYISVADADTYHTNQGNADWTLVSTALKEQALRRAVTYLSGEYRLRWAGYRAFTDQALDWPRSMVPVPDSEGGVAGYPGYVGNTVIPVEVKRACAELAYKALSSELAADLTRGVLKEKVGPLEVEYDPNSSQIVRYKAIDDLLRPYLSRAAPGGSAVRLVRG
jgi:hypothetical protein